MRVVLSGILGVALLSPGAIIAQSLFAPVVHIVAVDRVAYEDASLPEWGIQTRQTPSRKAAFQVWRSGRASRPLTVNYSIGGSASNGVDYAALSGQVTIPAGSRFARIIVRPIDDNEVEQHFVGTNYLARETVVLTLQPSSRYKAGWPRRAQAFIVDDDVITATPSVPQFPGPLIPYIPPGYGGSVESIAKAQRDTVARDYFRDQRDAIDSDYLSRIVEALGPEAERPPSRTFRRQR